MSFENLLIKAKLNDSESFEKLLMMYQPLLLKESIVNGVFDEDLYQELNIVFLRCVRMFDV